MATSETNGNPPSRGAAEQGSQRGVDPRLRQPAVPVAVAFIAGILVDRWTDMGGVTWAAAAVVGLLLSRIADRVGIVHPAAVMLLVACAGLGGLRHHVRWSAISPRDVSLHADSEPAAAKIVGVIASPVSLKAADDSDMTPPWMRVDLSQCDLDCERLIGAAGGIPAAGRVRLFVTGHVLHAGVGDRVEVIGQLVEPHGVQNPGGFDYSSHLRRSGIRCLVRVNHPDAVRVLEPRVSRRPARLRARLRDECEQMLVRHLDQRSVPLAMALLLGERTLLPADVRKAFAESGTVHLLAVSGLHVAILAALLLLVCRLSNVSLPVTTLVVLAGIASFAVVTNHRPSVIRASIVAFTVFAGWPWFRRAGVANLIAVCALIVLLINPADLFETGTQLSFLAVVAIGWAATLIARWRNSRWQSPWRQWVFDAHPGMSQSLLRSLVEGYVITAAICLFTMPLIAARYHIVAPVGFLLNVFLLPLVAIALWLGFLTLVCGLLAPWIVAGPAAMFDWSLQALQWIVDAAARVHLGHAAVAGPADWWLAAFYALLAAAMMARGGNRLRRWTPRAVVGWIIVGLVIPLFPARREGLRCTFLSVGHGCAVVIELPSGETLLYDAGTFGSALRGQANIQSALWERGITAIDAIIVSHADIDHFNAAAGVMETIPVGSLLCGRTFLDFAQQPVALLCETASREDVPIKLLQAADRIRFGDVELRVLHPPPHWRSERDNANSVVLQLRYAGRTLLLTGDLERDGLTALLQQPTLPVDVLLSPHHGSLRANPPALNQWAAPRYVIISGGDAVSAGDLRSVYTQAERVLSTNEAGAVTVHIAPSGTITVDEWIPTE